MQNIGAANRDDAFYRYKMPKMVSKTEGKGNGIKTNVVNMVEIAKALGRPASYPIKYFGCELGAQSKFDEKTGISLVNGAHSTAKLAELLEDFIKKYVQCYGCKNPETEIITTKTQMLTLKCAACGHISHVDMRDKLTTFILKHPPETKKGKDKAMRRAEKERLKEGEAADARKKEARKKGSAANLKDAATISKGSSKKKGNGDVHVRSPPLSQSDDNDQVSEVEDEDDDGIQWQTDTSREAAEQRIREQLSAVTADMVMLTTLEEKKKPVVKSPEPSIAREIKECLEKGPSAAEFKIFVSSLTGSPQDVMDALFVALFEGLVNGLEKEVLKKKKYLVIATQVTGSQLYLLHAIELLFEKVSPTRVKEVALFLKSLYDEDVLEEEFIIEWYNMGLKGDNKTSPVWKNVKPLVEWLQEAESEEE